MNSLRTLLLLLPALLSGCQVYTVTTPKPDYYYINPDKDLSNIGRVAIVEMNNDSGYPAISGSVTETLFQALQKKQLFGLTIVRQNDPAWCGLQLGLNSTYTLDQLDKIRKALKCDALLTGTITEYHPFPHMEVGLRLKLVDLRDGQLLWAIEQIWDSTDKTTEYRIKDYFQSQMNSSSVPLHEELMTVSPIKFIKFAAYEVAETLNPKRQGQKRTVFVLTRQ